MKIIDQIKYFRIYAYTYTGNINQPENVNWLSVGFTGRTLGEPGQVLFRDVCFATISSENPVDRRGKLWIRATAASSSAENELQVTIR